jgi:arsenical pump membrane protein
MTAPANTHAAIWLIAAAATAGVILRPWRIPEAVWAIAGALALVLLGLVPGADALAAVRRGDEVYLFLSGMMLLSELARREGLFDHLAGWAVAHARGSAHRLFWLVYAVGVLVTVFMSNDATAVVLTPAVYAVARKAGARPLPYLFACAFVANAASFVLPISNPANLVIFGDRLPALGHWFAQFALASVLSITATGGLLWWLHRGEFDAGIAMPAPTQPLSSAGRATGWGIAFVAVVLLVASALDRPLGWPTLLASVAVAAFVLGRERRSPRAVLAGIAWPVLALVAGLFVLVQGLEQTGVLRDLAQWLQAHASASPEATAWGAGIVTALACNLVNNLPAGLIAGSVAQAAQVTPAIQAAIAIGIDLGPNLSVTGSLATILWLIALRREGEHVGAWQFLKLGLLLMPAALLPALLAVVWQAA